MITLEQLRELGEGDTEIIRVDFTPKLGSDETIATIIEEPADDDQTGDLTLSAATINVAAYADETQHDTAGNDVTVAIGKAVYFSVSGQLASRGRYAITLSVTTSDGRTLARRLQFLVS